MLADHDDLGGGGWQRGEPGCPHLGDRPGAATRDDVVLVTVVDDEWGSVGGSALAELKRTAEERAERELAFARDLGDGPEVGSVVSVGSPMLALAEADAKADLVAVGTHKVGYFHGHALGSRSLQLAAVSTVPSAVVPVTSWRGRSGVAVGVADGVDSDDAVRFAAGGEPAGGAARPPPRGRRCAAGPASGSARPRSPRRSIPGLAIEVRSTADPASGALIGISRRAVLTVTGRRVARSGFLPLGRTNTDLLMNLAGPVVVVPHTVGRGRGGGVDRQRDARARHRRPVVAGGELPERGQIYLRDNALLRHPLAPEHVKPRLLGHWGTAPALNLVWAHLNRAICERALQALYIAGPGHGGPAMLANAWLEGAYSERYPACRSTSTG